MFPFFNNYPGTDLHEIDLAYILKLCAELRASNKTLTEWKAAHEKEYDKLNNEVDGLIHNLVDVIVPWDSSIAYHIFSIVSWDGTNYIAVQDVPVGAMITNTDYWQPANTVTDQINAIGLIVSELETKIEKLYVDTADELITTDVEPDMVVQTLGYHSIGDKGACTYKIVNAAGTYSLALDNGLFADPVFGLFITPEMFGAYGDGETDDTQAIQAAIDYATIHGTTVIIPGKPHIVSNTLNVTTGGVHVMGDSVFSVIPTTGPGWVFNIMYTGTGAAIHVDNTAGYSLFENLRIVSTIGTDSEGVGYGIVLDTIRTTVRNCHIRHFAQGVRIYNTSSGWEGENTVDGCMFDYNTIGIFSGYSNGAGVTDNIIKNNTFVHGTYGLDGDFADSYLITENHFYSEEGVVLRRARNIQLIDNYFDNGYHTSVRLNIDNNAIITDNTFLVTTGNTAAYAKIAIKYNQSPLEASATVKNNALTDAVAGVTNVYLLQANLIKVSYSGNLTNDRDLYSTAPPVVDMEDRLYGVNVTLSSSEATQTFDMSGKLLFGDYVAVSAYIGDVSAYKNVHFLLLNFNKTTKVMTVQRDSPGNYGGSTLTIYFEKVRTPDTL